MGSGEGVAVRVGVGVAEQVGVAVGLGEDVDVAVGLAVIVAVWVLVGTGTEWVTADAGVRVSAARVIPLSAGKRDGFPAGAPPHWARKTNSRRTNDSRLAPVTCCLLTWLRGPFMGRARQET